MSDGADRYLLEVDFGMGLSMAALMGYIGALQPETRKHVALTLRRESAGELRTAHLALELVAALVEAAGEGRERRPHVRLIGSSEPRST